MNKYIAPSFNDNRLSVYIPYVSSHHSKTSVINIFHEFQLGQVDRVDFVKHKDTSGFELFVHFHPYSSQTMNELIHHHSRGGGYRIMVDISEPWFICQNHNPIPDTNLNIHQLAQQSKLLEKKMKELQKAVDIIPEITETLKSLNGRISYLEDPEWLSDISAPLSIDDLSDCSHNIKHTMDVVEEDEDKIEESMEAEPEDLLHKPVTPHKVSEISMTPEEEEEECAFYDSYCVGVYNVPSHWM